MKRMIKRSMLPFAVIALAVLRCVRPLIRVRLFVCNSVFLGHIALEPDTYLSEPRTLIQKRTHDVWTFGSRATQANPVLTGLWQDNVTIWPSWIVDRLIRAGEIVPSLGLQVIPGGIFGSQYWDRSGPHLKVPQEMRDRCERLLEEVGVRNGEPICCLVVRDDGYWSNTDKSNLSGEPRNRSINDFGVAAEVLADAGYWVFRMGERVKGFIPTKHPRVFDYANSNIWSKEMDIYLMSRCSFAFSSLTGPAAVALAFRRPVFYFDVTLMMQCFHGSKLVSWNPSQFIDNRSGRQLGMAEVFERGVPLFRTMDDFTKAGISIRNHNEIELGELARDAVVFAEGYWSGRLTTNPQQRAFQSLFADLMLSQFGERHTFKSWPSPWWLDRNLDNLGLA